MFSFNPDPEDGIPARIIRYSDVPLPGGYLATWDRNTNLLLVDRNQFEKLSENEKHILLRTQKRQVPSVYDPREVTDEQVELT